MKRNRFTLKDYSCFAGVVLLVHNNADAEIIYTDIDPDTVLQVSGETAFLDIDNNGTVDFAFLVTGGTYPVYDSSSIFLGFARRHYLWVGPYASENEIAGHYIYHSSYGGSFIYLADRLGDFVIINDELHFQNNGFQIMAGVRSFQTSFGEWIEEIPYGDWFGAENYFLALYFEDEDNHFHYGWIRCSVSDSADVLTIKDYAYNTEPEAGLLAGTLISGINETNNTLAATVYAFNNNIYIYKNDYENTGLYILDISGKDLINKELSNRYEIIDMNSYPAGIYLVALTQGERRMTKKVIIE